MGPGGFDFSFEDDDTLDANGYKRLIVEEAISFRTERALAKRTGRSSLVGGDDKGASLDTAGGSDTGRGAGAMPAARFYGAGPETVVKR